jgi:hypothetical protein
MQQFMKAYVKTTTTFICLVLITGLLFQSCKKETVTNDPPTGSTEGQLLFWSATDLACGSVTVNVAGLSSVIMNYYAQSAPGCGATGCANFSLAPGTYSYTASCSNKNWSGNVTVTSGNCAKIQLTGTGGGGGTTTGQGMFWTATDLGCGSINVVCGGITRSITGYYGSVPACGASSAATFDLPAGTYSYSASCSNKTWNGNITISSGACSKIQLTGSGGGGGSVNGQGMLWIASDLGCGTINVTCAGVTRSITSYYAAGAPACAASGCATFDLAPGTYSYSASCTGKTWSGNITVSSGACSKIQLTSSGGGGTPGQGMFWTATNFGCGSINVTCNGVTRTISSYYSSLPSCGATGCATFSFSPGTYSYSASCTGRTWSGTITITANGCSTIKFI